MSTPKSKPKITPLSKLIMDEDIEALEQYQSAGWDINGPLQFSQFRFVPAITFACENDKADVIVWLIKNKSRLDDSKTPAIVAASLARRSTLQILLDNGADVNAQDHIGRSVVTRALYAKKLELVSYFVENGYNVKADGRSLRQAVFDRSIKAVELLLGLGFDPNFFLPDQVFPYNSSPVHIASSYSGSLKIVKLLVEHGADVTLKDYNGDRPFSAAKQNGKPKLIEYLRALEPADWHDEAKHLASLKQYNLPESMLNICKDPTIANRKIVFQRGADWDTNYVVLNEALMLKPFMYGKKELVEFIGETDNYETFLSWYPAKKRLAYTDPEHGIFKVVGKWEAFVADPDAFVVKYLSPYLA